VLKRVLFDVKPYDLFRSPLWFADGVQILQNLAQVGIESEFYMEKMRILDHVRKKTTQKVNLYEKVQIPGYQEAILKIKRFMEDEENLSKAAQKIVKERQQREEAAA
jgi:V/A-type H+-transporting ATPase subunit D